MSAGRRALRRSASSSRGRRPRGLPGRGAPRDRGDRAQGQRPARSRCFAARPPARSTWPRSRLERDDFRRGVRRLVNVWKNMHAGDVYRADVAGIAGAAHAGSRRSCCGGLGSKNPVSLLDNSPLQRMLEKHLDFDGIRQCDRRRGARRGRGHRVGLHVGRVDLVLRRRRRGRRLATLAARGRAGRSSDVDAPDGLGRASVRVSAGAHPSRVLRRRVDAADRTDQPRAAPGRGSRARRHRRRHRPVAGTRAWSPSAAPRSRRSPGHALNSIFLDALEADLERLERINRTIALLNAAAGGVAHLVLKHVDCLVIAPSEPLEQIALRHVRALPRTVRCVPARHRRDAPQRQQPRELRALRAAVLPRADAARATATRWRAATRSSRSCARAARPHRRRLRTSPPPPTIRTRCTRSAEARRGAPSLHYNRGHAAGPAVSHPARLAALRTRRVPPRSRARALAAAVRRPRRVLARPAQPARRAPAPGARKPGADLRQVRPGAVDAPRPAAADIADELARCRTACRPSRTRRSRRRCVRAYGRPVDDGIPVVRSACRSRAPRSRRFTSPSFPTARRSR